MGCLLDENDLKNYKLKEFFLSMLDFTFGCTEPVAIALNGAHLKNIIIENYFKNYDSFNCLIFENFTSIDEKHKNQKSNFYGKLKIDVFIDKMTYKNAFNVGIPGTKIKGVKEAFLLGFLFGDKNKNLEIFNSISENDFELFSKILSDDKKKKKIFEIFDFNSVDSDLLFIKSIAKIDDKYFVAQTENTHGNVLTYNFNEKDKIEQNCYNNHKFNNNKEAFLNQNFDRRFYEEKNFLKIIDFLYLEQDVREKIIEGIVCNFLASHEKNEINDFEDFFVSQAIFNRMVGKKLKVLACAKSGNKGLTSLVSTFHYYITRKSNIEKFVNHFLKYNVDITFFYQILNFNNKNEFENKYFKFVEMLKDQNERENIYNICRKYVEKEEKLIKASILACYITSIITNNFGFISSICGVMYGAGAGFLASMLFIDNKFELFSKSFLNYISSFGGVFCDGAKSSCSIKGSTAIRASINSKKLTEKKFCVDYKDGYLGSTFFETIQNLKKFNSAIYKINETMLEILKEKNI